MPHIPPERLRRLHRIQSLIEDQVVLIALVRRRHEMQERRKQYWVKPWIQRRELLGTFDKLMVELERESLGDFKVYLRMKPAMFHELVDRMTHRIEKQINYRSPLSSGLRLAVTLRYLATGDAYRSLMYSFRVPHNTMSGIVKEVCSDLVDEYAPDVFNTPSTPDSWREVAERFGSRWNFHHTCGAIDGKHIRIKCPKHSGSVYYNYKGFFLSFSSPLLMATTNSFGQMWVPTVRPRTVPSSTMQCVLKRSIENRTIGFPDPEPLPHDDENMPYFIVGGDAFPLKTWMMKPFAHRNQTHEEAVFNYRLSRARHIVENCFGILVHRWRCLLGMLQQEPDTCKLIVKACSCPHNLMRLRYPGLQNHDVDQEDTSYPVPGASTTLPWTRCAVNDKAAISGGQGSEGAPEMLLQQRRRSYPMARLSGQLIVDYLYEPMDYSFEL